ncbi:MAG: calcium-binding protein [Nostoc sp. DedQUE04]|uniref:calcium-binding protein n=1 Tax=Nostoc sp. DedQUE04 TaxID=3075390 RepID=UPI002AD1FC63|nr:calcium-binding protein [Nostoc sp. DedQUE04]MDZ8140101.1 calcium-binding protein [Nostoc sp. DedQUE04]
MAIIQGQPTNGNDVIFADGANDFIDGLQGIDLINGGSGNDTLFGRDGNDIILGDPGNDLIDGGFDNDDLNGNAGNDTLIGSFGNDSLFGGSSSDSLSGGAGNDILIGFNGVSGNELDTLRGGSGADTFALGDRSGSFYLNSAGSSFATIVDFDSSQADKIRVNGSAFGYTLNKNVNFSGGSALDTSILKNGDLIAVVQDNTNVSISFDFITA